MRKHPFFNRCTRGAPAIASALLMACTWAQAQDNGVQVYGAVAASVVHLSNQADGTGARLVAGPWTASALGFRGSENLGGGLTASFRFESSLDVQTGAGGRTIAGSNKFFDKAAWLSLGNQQLNLTAGRQLHAGIDRIAETLDVFQANADGRLVLSTLALNATNSFGGFDTRVDQSLKLRAQLPAGIKAGLSHGFAVDGKFGKSLSADLGIQTPVYGLGAYVFNYTNATGELDQKTWGLGGNYLVGKARVYAHYLKAVHDKSAGGATQQSDAVWSLAVAYPVTSALTVKAAYYRDGGSDVGGVSGRSGARSTVAVMGDYAFSKRTSVNFGVFRNSLSGAFTTDLTSLAALGLINPATRSISGSSNTGLAVGVNHRF